MYLVDCYFLVIATRQSNFVLLRILECFLSETVGRRKHLTAHRGVVTAMPQRTREAKAAEWPLLLRLLRICRWIDPQPRSARFGRQPSAFANCSSTAEMRGPNVASSSLALRDTSGRPALRL